MSEIRNCKRCGKLFSSLKNEKICKECVAKEEETFKQVKDYLYYNQGATITDIINEIDVSVAKIKSWLREERIEIVNHDGHCFLECERCSVAIVTGRLCKDCAAEVEEEMKNTAGEVELKIKDSEIKIRHLK